MLSRTRHEEMVFARPFMLKGWAKPHPAGAYDVETEEELIEGLSFPAWRRVGTTITRTVRDGGIVQAIAVDPQELAEAKAADSA